ncbi:MAG: contractile injection system tape measure protein [Bacteroidia bacterium]|jgi:hypothetical protein|nr:contractile injection system tape measure protein [Bacteroidia bacterium]
MSEQVFAIGRSVFELDFPDQREAWTLQTRVSYLFNDKLKQILEQELRRADVPGLHCVLDSLDLQLGDIAYDDIEKELPERLAQALRNALPEAINELRSQPGSNGMVMRSEENTLRQFQHFLRNGELSWSTEAKKSTPDEWLGELLAHEPKELVKLLRKHSNADVIKRLVYQFSDEQLAALIEVLEPGDARFILRYAAHLDVQHRRKPVVPESEAAFRHTKWQVIFTYLLDTRGSVFNRRMFVKSTIAQLAAHYNMSYATLLAHFATAVREMMPQGGIMPALPQLLLELEMEEQEKNAEASGTAPQESMLVVLSRYLLYGSLPAQQKLTLAEFAKAVSQLPFQEPRKLAVVLRRSGSFDGVAERYLGLVREPARSQTIHALEPADAPFILGFIRTSADIQQRERITTLPQAEFMQQQWTLVFGYLLTDRGSVFNTRMFVRSAIKQMAAHYNTGYDTLISLFGRAAKQLHAQLPASLPLVLIELYSETEAEAQEEILPEKISVSPSEEPEQPLSLHYLAELFQYILIHGRLPWWAKQEEQHTVSGAGYLLEQLLPQPDLLRQSVAEIARHEAAFERLLHIAGDAMPKLLHIFALPQSEALELWLVQLEKQLAAIIPLQQRRTQLLQLWQGRLLQVMIHQQSGNAALVNWINEVWGELSIRSQSPAATVFQLLLDAAEALPASARLLLSGLLKQVYERAGNSVYDDAPHTPLQQQEEELWNDTELFLKEEEENFSGEKSGEGAEKIFSEKEQDIIEDAQGIKEEEDSATLIFSAEEGEEYERFLQRTRALRLRALQGLYNLLAVSDESTNQKGFSAAVLLSALAARFMQMFAWLTPAQAESLARNTLAGMPESQTAAASVVHGESVNTLLELLLGRDTPQSSELENVLHKIFRTPPQGWREIMAALLRIPQSRKRLAALLHGTTLLRVLATIAQSTQAGMPARQITPALQADMLELVRRIFPAQLTRLRELILRLALHTHAATMPASVWLSILLKALARNSSLAYDTLAQQLAAAANRYQSEWKSDLPRLLVLLGNPGYLARSSDNTLKRLRQLREKAAAEERKRTAELKQQQKQLTTETDEPLGVFVTNAGLVLLWPFLTRLFTRCGWLNGVAFTSEQNAYRAVHLLQYLVNTQQQQPEYLLVLNKLLCGLSKAKPVEKNIILTAEEKQIGEDLLAAVIKQWSVLGNTSIAGLRETFLERGGQILFTGQHAVLKVERKAFDKLLGRLPWSINLIRLPWMQQPLYVEWKT